MKFNAQIFSLYLLEYETYLSRTYIKVESLQISDFAFLPTCSFHIFQMCIIKFPLNFSLQSNLNKLGYSVLENSLIVIAH